MDSNSFNNLILFTITAFGAGVTAFWFGLTLWAWQDMKARSRDPLARVAATFLVFAIPFVGIMVYLMLRPRETLADAYERSLEEEALLQEIEQKPTCPGCGRLTHENWQACPYCHTRLKKACLHCGSLLELNWNLCPVCIAPQVSYQESAQPEPPAEQKRPRSIMRQLDDQSPYEYSDVEFVDD